MKKIVFSNGEELEISGITNIGNVVEISVKSSDLDSVRDIFRDNPVATNIMRYYVGTDLMCGYRGYTRLTGMTYTPDVTDSIDYTVDDPCTESGFSETHTDIITIRMERGTNGSALLDEQNALAADVEALKADMAAINMVLGGEDSVD